MRRRPACEVMQRLGSDVAAGQGAIAMEFDRSAGDVAERNEPCLVYAAIAYSPMRRVVGPRESKMAMDEKEFVKIFSPPTDEDRAAGLALLPQHVRDALPRTRQCDDNVGRVKLYAPWNDGAYAGWCWHVISVNDADDNVAFCYVEGIANEFGSVRLDRIASFRGPRGERVIRATGDGGE